MEKQVKPGEFILSYYCSHCGKIQGEKPVTWLRAYAKLGLCEYCYKNYYLDDPLDDPRP